MSVVLLLMKTSTSLLGVGGGDRAEWCACDVRDRALGKPGYLEQVGSGARKAVARTDPNTWSIRDVVINDVCRADTLCLDDGPEYIFMYIDKIIHKYISTHT